MISSPSTRDAGIRRGHELLLRQRRPGRWQGDVFSYAKFAFQMDISTAVSGALPEIETFG